MDARVSEERLVSSLGSFPRSAAGQQHVVWTGCVPSARGAAAIIPAMPRLGLLLAFAFVVAGDFDLDFPRLGLGHLVRVIALVVGHQLAVQ